MNKLLRFDWDVIAGITAAVLAIVLHLEIGVQNGPTSGARSACKMDPPYRTREGTGEFASGFKGQGCSRWTITDGFGELIVTA